MMWAMIPWAAWLVLTASGAAAAPAPERPDRIAFLGDSITFPDADAPALTYPFYVEAWLRQQAPGRRLIVHNFSWPGETSAQAAARFAFDVAPLKPSLVITALGMNDGLVGTT